jgi:hypothetical protein
MALTNAEKQRAWRQRHAERRRTVVRIATMLMRRSHKDGRTFETRFGWNAVTFDGYFHTLASRLADVLKTDRAIMQLRWALTDILTKRRQGRSYARMTRERSREQAV